MSFLLASTNMTSINTFGNLPYANKQDKKSKSLPVLQASRKFAKKLIAFGSGQACQGVPKSEFAQGVRARPLFTTASSAFSEFN